LDTRKDDETVNSKLRDEKSLAGRTFTVEEAILHQKNGQVQGASCFANVILKSSFGLIPKFSLK
jgi:hypothetical protein